MANLQAQLYKTDEYANLPDIQQHLFSQMAGYIDANPDLISLDTEELTVEHPGTTHEMWRVFLQLPVVERYIRSILKFNAGVSFRKAHKALTIEAERGNTQAAQQVTKISEILTQEQNNRTVVLTHVPRNGKPNIPEPEPQPPTEQLDTPTLEEPHTEDETNDLSLAPITIPEITPTDTQPNPEYDHTDPLRDLRDSPRYKAAMGLDIHAPLPASFRPGYKPPTPEGGTDNT